MSNMPPPANKPEAFGETTKIGLSAINSTTLATCTLVGAGLLLYADLSSGLLPSIASYVALANLTRSLAGRSADTRFGGGALKAKIRDNDSGVFV